MPLSLIAFCGRRLGSTFLLAVQTNKRLHVRNLCELVRLSGPLSALTLPSQKQPLHWDFNAVGGDEGTGAENPGSVNLNIVVNSLLAICEGSSFAIGLQ